MGFYDKKENVDMYIEMAKGIIIHSLWYGSGEESFEGMLNIYYTEKDVKELLEDHFEILDLKRYTEMDKDDSLYVIARVK